MKQNSVKSLMMVVASLVLMSDNAAAATDGTTGTTSSGSSTLNVIIPPLAKITGLADLDFGGNPSYTGSTAGDTDDETVCVYTNLDNSGGATYSVNMQGSHSGAADAFALKHASLADTIAYQAQWDDNSSFSSVSNVGTVGGTATTITGQTGWSNTLNCGGSDNAGYRVNFTESELLNSKRHGTYTGTLTITITPVP
jgi:hypothetical protein